MSARPSVFPLALVGSTCGPLDSADPPEFLSEEREVDVVDSDVDVLEVVELVVELLDERVELVDDDVVGALVDVDVGVGLAGDDAADPDPVEQPARAVATPAIKKIATVLRILELTWSAGLLARTTELNFIRFPHLA